MFSITHTTNYLMKICDKPDTNLDSKTFKMWSRAGSTVFLDDIDTREFYNALEEIQKDEFMKENFAKKQIEIELENILSGALKLESSKRRNFFEKELENLKTALKKKIKDWTFLIPIENLTVKRKFEVGKVKFHKITKYKKGQIMLINKNILANNPNYTNKQKKEFLKQNNKYFFTNIYGRTCAEVTVKGVLDFAYHKALQEVRASINVLKLYSYHNDDFYKRYFGIVGEVVKCTQRPVMKYTKDKKSMNLSLERVGYLYDFELDKNRTAYMKKKWF